MALIIDFRITLTSIPPWMLPYSSVATGCAHGILAIMKVKGS